MKLSFSSPKMTNQRLVTLAMLAALAIIISKFSITVIPNQLMVSFTFIVNTVIGMVAGPIWGFISLALIDVVDNLSSGQGNFIIWWTLMEAVEGFLYGLFFHGQLLARDEKKDWLKVTLATLVIMTFSTFLVTPFLVQTYFGTPFIAQYLAGRWLKIFEIPLRIFVTMLVLPQLQKIPELKKLVKADK
ncbi:folate family ECF transporter S component [Streptococcus cuniculipharyngis]|uniref:Folate family ECF transporter S component n=1 Tax=Streptococcus cuniculipharyngis TaxID=1562651 RepID=A0A5C5SD07_9STRE|nr:folate family ECF transporter S component [Streptococcus cuniculipharyngis]TWS98654.1 folate family ECF transporter S component [Streptococcus cuniculipharyngis]